MLQEKNLITFMVCERKLKELFFITFTYSFVLTHYWHFHCGQFGWHGTANRYLQRRYIEGSHIVFAAAFIVVVDDVFAYIIIWSRVFNMRLTTPIIHNKHQHQNWFCGVCVQRLYEFCNIFTYVEDNNAKRGRESAKLWREEEKIYMN